MKKPTNMVSKCLSSTVHMAVMFRFKFYVDNDAMDNNASLEVVTRLIT